MENNKQNKDYPPEYKIFLSHFMKYPFQTNYVFKNKILKDDINKVKELPNTYYNSFYIFLFFREYINANPDFVGEVIDDILEKIFLNENETEKNELSTNIKVLVPEIDVDQQIEYLEIEKLLLVLDSIKHDKKCLQRALFLTNNIIIQDGLQLKYKPSFLEVFIKKSKNIHLHKNIADNCIQILNKQSVNVFFKDADNEEDVNYNIDFLVASLCLIYMYLKNTLVNHEDYILSFNESTNEIENTINNMYNEMFQNLHKLKKFDYCFTKVLYDEMYDLLTKSQILNNDLFIIFEFSISILILSQFRNSNFTSYNAIEKVVLTKEFLIDQDNMLKLQNQVVYCIFALKDIDLAEKHLNIILNSDAIIYLNRLNRTNFLEFYDKHRILTVVQEINIVRKTYYNIKMDLDYHKTSKNQKIPYLSDLIDFFLQYISFFYMSSNFIELNNYFKELIDYCENIEYYADFLSLNNFDPPIYSFIKSKSKDFILKFYLAFFKRIRKNYVKKIEKTNDNDEDFYLIVDKHVTSFCNFFLSNKSMKFVPIFNIIPYLPAKREFFLIYYEIWKAIFDGGMEGDVLFFQYKTPALVGIASSLAKNDLSDKPIHSKLVKLMEKEIDKEFVDKRNIGLAMNSYLLAIIYFTEKEKIRNLNFTGVLEYVNDTQLLSLYYSEINFIMKVIHCHLKSSIEFLTKYIMNILDIFYTSFESSKTIMLNVIKIILKYNENVVYNEKLNVKFNHLLSYLNSNKISKTDGVIFNDLLALYKKGFLAPIKENTINFYNYIIFSKCEFTLFSEFEAKSKGNYFEAINNSIDTFKLIKYFPTEDQILDFKENEGEQVKDTVIKCELLNPVLDLTWLIDVVYLKRNDSSVVRNSLNIVRKRLSDNFTYIDLYILLRIYNIIQVREDDFDYFLKQSLNIGLDFKTETNTIKNLANESTTFFKFYFESLYFIITGKKIRTEMVFPNKIVHFQDFSFNELITIHNMFKNKLTFNILGQHYNYLSYFFNYEKLSLADIICILMNCDLKDVIMRALEELKNQRNNVIFYIPQLVQCLTRDLIFADIFLVLLDLCHCKALCHFLLWNLKSNCLNDHQIFKKCINDIENTYAVRSENIKETTIDESSDNDDDVKISNGFMDELKFFNELTNISSLMMPFIREEKESKKAKINKYLSTINVPSDIYLPTDMNYTILKIVPNSGRVLQSAAKVPFMASFLCIKNEDINQEILNSVDLQETSEVEPPFVVKNLIFKAGDDCRQDMLALQLIELFKNIFEKSNLDIYLYPYKVIATGVETGIIEVIPNSITRDQMGREKINNLLDFFEFKYGFKESITFKKAANNFVTSLAGYSLVTYFLNIKDRHNANIMINEDGHIIHIDFGFIFEISPGIIAIEGPIKLTKEIYDFLTVSELFDKYVDLMVKGFFALRRNSKDIILVVDSFKNSGLPCYKKHDVENFIDRFKFKMGDEEARNYIVTLINNSIKKFRTWVYDKYQAMANNIAF